MKYTRKQLENLSIEELRKLKQELLRNRKPTKPQEIKPIADNIDKLILGQILSTDIRQMPEDAEINYFVELDITPDIKRRGNRSSAKSRVENVSLNITNMLSQKFSSRFQGEPIITKESHKLTSGLFLNRKIKFEVDDLIAIKNIPEVKNINVVSRLQLLMDVSSPLINAPSVWSVNDSNNQPITGKGVNVAVIDSGVDYTHPDLGGSSQIGEYNDVVVDGFNFATNSPDGIDLGYHGTHVASTIAGNSEYYSGVAPDALIHTYAVADEDGLIFHSALISALEAAVENNIDVVNMSLGGPGFPFGDPVVDAVNNITDETNMIIVISAGNSGPGPDPSCRIGEYPLGDRQSICCPSCAEGSISVAASNDFDGIANFSSRGPTWPMPDGTTLDKPDLAAPGVDICGAASYLLDMNEYPDFQCFGDLYHVEFNGTSMAAPHVTGAAALIKQLYPDANQAAVKSYLKSSAVNLSGYSYYEQGAGRIDLTTLTDFSQVGCMDDTACNYNAFALNDDGSCEYPLPFRTCSGFCINDIDGDDICDEEDDFINIFGCTDPTAVNYDEDANSGETQEECFYYEDLPYPSDEGFENITPNEGDLGGWLNGNPFRQNSFFSMTPSIFSLVKLTINGVTYDHSTSLGEYYFHDVSESDQYYDEITNLNEDGISHTHHDFINDNKFYLQPFCGKGYNQFAYPQLDAEFPIWTPDDVDDNTYNGDFFGSPGYDSSNSRYNSPLFNDMLRYPFGNLTIETMGGNREEGTSRGYDGPGPGSGDDRIIYYYNKNLIGSQVTFGSMHLMTIWIQDFSTSLYAKQLCDVDIQATGETGVLTYEEPRFIIYDGLNQSYHEFDCTARDQDGNSTDCRVSPFSIKRITLTERIIEQYTYELKGGNNHISFPFQMDNNSVEDFMINNNVNYILSQGQGLFNNNGVISGNYTTFEPQQGMWINLPGGNMDTIVINVGGTALPPLTYDLTSLGAGSNYQISYDGIDNMDTIQALGEFENQVEYILGDGTGLFNDGAGTGVSNWSGNLTTLKFGEGYWIQTIGGIDGFQWNRTIMTTSTSARAENVNVVERKIKQLRLDGESEVIKVRRNQKR